MHVKVCIAVLLIANIFDCCHGSIYDVAENLGIELSDEDIELSKKNITGFCNYYGYPLEKYSVTTEDGYILEVHRIPHGKNETKKSKRNICFLQHGLFSSSMDWVVTGPKLSLAFLLADKGYDVWMGNSRGNDYSQKHKKYDVDTTEFWKFSWHEMGIYDLPATIDFILDKTKKKSLFYLGHSQGTTIFFVMASMKPEYNKKIKAMFALAPVAFMKHMTSPIIRATSAMAPVLELLAKESGTKNVEVKKGILKHLTDRMCKGKIGTFLCSNLFFAVTGFNPKNIDMKKIPLISTFSPSNTGIRQMIHYGQLFVSGRFCQYDYGVLNFKKYQSLIPPSYPLNKVTASVYLIYSLNDLLTSLVDIKKLELLLPNCKKVIRVEDIAFSHTDYMVGKNAKKVVYNVIFSKLKEYE